MRYLILLAFLWPQLGYGATFDGKIRYYSDTAICNAIYRAENSHSHPYGVMIKCKDPRQVCLNTIRHRRSKWNKLKWKDRGDFIVFLGKTYSPPNINPNWVRLVKYFLAKNYLTPHN